MDNKQVSIDVTQEDRISYKFVFKVKVMRVYNSGDNTGSFFINVICDTFDIQEVIRKINLHLNTGMSKASILSIVYDPDSQYIY